MLRVFEQLGEVCYEAPKKANGKDTKFVATVRSPNGDKDLTFGILHYDWKRTIGVDKIQQAVQHTRSAELDGSFVIGSHFSRSAIDTAFRINERTDTRIMLLDKQQFDSASNFTES